MRVHQQRLARVERIGDGDVAALQAVQREAGEQSFAELPLHADFAVAERLRFEAGVGCGQGRQLVAGARHEAFGVAGVQRQVRIGLVDQAGARRQQAVAGFDARAGAAVQEIHLEAFEAQAADQLPALADVDLILHVQRGDVGDAMVVGVGRALAEADRQGRHRIGDADGFAGLRAAGRAEIAGLSDVLRVLPAQFGADQDAVGDVAAFDVEDVIGLVEQVAAVGALVVGRQRDRGAGGVDRAREHVLVELAVVGVTRAAAQHGAVQVVFDQHVQAVHVGFGAAVGAAAEECAPASGQRFVLVGRHAAVDRAFVAEDLRGEHDAGVVADAERQSRRDAVQAARHAVAEAAGVFGHGVQAPGQGVVGGVAEVGLDAVEIVAAGLHRKIADAVAVGLLGHAVDDAAGAAAAEDHRVRALQHLHLADVVQVAVVLHVVAHAVGEEVAGAGVAAHHRRVAVAFALRHAHARHVADHIGHAVQGLVGDLLLGDHADRLRRVLQRGFGLHRAIRVAGLVAEREAADFDLVEGGRRVRRGLGVGGQNEQQGDGERVGSGHGADSM